MQEFNNTVLNIQWVKEITREGRLDLKEVEKEEQTKHKTTRRTQLIKVIVEINEREQKNNRDN